MLFGLMSMPQAQAQVFLDEESANTSMRGRSDDPNLPNIPVLGSTQDQYDNLEIYTPLGSGMLALGLLGGAYLISKKRKEE